jgi:glutaredoxin
MKLALTLLAVLAAPAMAGVYKWTDAQGHTQYSDTPSASNAVKLRLQTYSGPAQVSQAVGADAGVTLYTTSWCAVCKRAKAFLREKSIPFSEWDVEKTDYGAAKFRQLGGTGVPLITVGAHKMMGFDPGSFMEMWQASQN